MQPQNGPVYGQPEPQQGVGQSVGRRAAVRRPFSIGPALGLAALPSPNVVESRLKARDAAVLNY
jgi:hypothetical protein